jgi:hypothetical protein
MILFTDKNLCHGIVKILKRYIELYSEYIDAKNGDDKKYERDYKTYLGVEEYAKTPGCMGYVKIDNKSYEFVFESEDPESEFMRFKVKSFGTDNFSTWSSSDSVSIESPGNFREIIEDRYPEYFV